VDLVLDLPTFIVMTIYGFSFRFTYLHRYDNINSGFSFGVTYLHRYDNINSGFSFGVTYLHHY